MDTTLPTKQDTFDIQAAIERAIKHHQAGQLSMAERLYRQILHFSPNNVLANHHLGIIAHQTGKYAIAAKLIGKALSIKPDYPEAHYNLGNTLKKLGKSNEAVECFRKAISIKTDYSKAYYNLGNTLHEQGKLDEAEGCFRKALSINQNYTEVLNSLGVILQVQKKFDEASEHFRKAISVKPDYAKAHYNLGNTLHEQGKFDEAEGCFRKALSIKSDYTEAYYSLGITLKEQGKLDEATNYCRKALYINPNCAEAHNNLGVTLQEQNVYEEAEVHFRKALSINPECAETLFNLSTLLKQNGKIDEATSCLEKALSIKPDYAEAHHILASIRTYTAPDSQLKLMEDLFNKEDTSDSSRIYLAFGLGKAYEDLKNFDIAFDFIRQANTLKRRTFNYSIAREQKLFSVCQKTFGLQFPAKSKKSEIHDETPIFIIGMPRSGTSLVEQILASHPMVHGAGELTNLEKFFLKLTNEKSIASAFECIAKDDGTLVTQIGAEYIKKLREYSDSTRFITDKMPYNFLYIGLIHLCLPKARIIHCNREPMDTCLSIFKNCFRYGHRYAYDQKNLGQYYLLYQDIMRHWQNIVPEIIYNLCYEDLVRDQEGQTRKLLEHCELPWDKACLSYHKTPRTVATASSVQVRKPIYQDSIQRWKKYEKQLKTLKSILKN